MCRSRLIFIDKDFLQGCTRQINTNIPVITRDENDGLLYH